MRLFAAAGEASGDALLADVVAELRARTPGLRVRGVAGPRMRAAGVEAVARAEDATVLGLVEAVGALPRLARLLARLEDELAQGDVLLTADSPSLLLRLARRAKRRGIPAVHVVSPQVWAWRPGRIDRVAAAVDVILCLLPFEPALYSGRVRALFVGHPAAAARGRPVQVPGRPVFALCPGSREREVRALWPVFREVARRLRERFPDAGFVVPVAPTVARPGGLDAVYAGSIAEVAGADAALVASGTATIELAALDVPMAVAYRVHPLTAAIARRWLAVRNVALPNVLAGRTIVPEHLQELDPDAIAADLAALVGVRGQVPRELVASLAGEGAIGRIADEVEGWLRIP
jgi:lipid-A-disaccharide synthase